MKIVDKAIRNSKLHNQIADISLVLIKRYERMFKAGKVTTRDKAAITRLEDKRKLLARRIVKI